MQENNEIEKQYLYTQLNSNNFMIEVMNKDIAKLGQYLHEKRQTIDQLTDYNRQIEQRISALGITDKKIVVYEPFK